jgi:mono/diheme cytochrome c family protein
MDAHHDHPHEPVVLGEGEVYGLLAEYDTPGELVEAARKVREAGYTKFDCYSPFPVHGIDDAIGIKRTILPALIFGGGFLGTAGGLYLQWWCNAHNWAWNISGKPSWSIPANVPIAFETTILMAVFTSFFGMWILNKLPQVWHPLFRIERFGRVTDDAFLLAIEASDRRFDLDKTTALLEGTGPIELETCRLDPDPAKKQMPKWITAMIVASTAFALIPFAIAAKARNSKSSEPHLHIFPDMDFQPKFKSDTAADMFPDDRANRGEIDGTISRDPASLKADPIYYYGLDNGAWTSGFPQQLDLNETMVKRGQNRFNIYCTPCHGYDGQGHGAVPERLKLTDGKSGILTPADLTLPAGTAVNMPNGQLFNTISNGANTMMGYAGQIPHADRWAIVLYVRALQRARSASKEDVPADQQGSIR